MAFGLSACEAPRTVDLSNVKIRERSASQPDAIQGGTLDTSSSNVVAILIGAGQGGICTGSLIAPNLVLTARHCVGSTQGDLGSCTATPFGNSPYPASGFRITTSPNAAAAVFTGQSQWPTANNTTWFTGSQVLFPPTPGNTICGGDIALIRLSANIDNVCPLIPRVDSAVPTNEGYTAIGYGITSPNGQLAGTRYQVAGMSVLCSGNCNESSVSDAYEWVGGAQTQKGTCEGDSGGPSVDSQGRVTGALSRGSADACNLSVYSGVFGHAQWIKDQTVQAAMAGGFTVPAWATGGSTTVNPCASTDAGVGGGTGAGGGGGDASTACGAGEYCAALGASGQSACVTTSNGVPSGAPSCTGTLPCSLGFSCWGNGASSGVCLRDCTDGVAPTGGGSGSTGGGTGAMDSCPTGQWCIDASGDGDYACVSTSNAVPADAPDCTGNGVCVPGYSCWGVTQTRRVCLADCGTSSHADGGMGGGAAVEDAGVGDAGVDAGTEGANGAGGGVPFPSLGGGDGTPMNSGCGCTTVDPSLVAFALFGLLRRRSESVKS